MLLVKTFLDKSDIHGIGLFAAEPIKKGQIIWEYMSGYDRQYTQSHIDKNPIIESFFDTYASVDAGICLLDGDNARFMNHSLNPNIETGAGTSPMIALRDIEIGEEITCDYAEFDDDYAELTAF